MSWTLSEEQLLELREAFKLYDKENLGFIGVDEMKAVFRSLGYHIPNDQIENLITQVESDGDNTVDIVEFLAFLARKCREDSNLGISDIMKIFDMDRDGKLSEDDLRKVLEESGEILSEDSIKEIFKTYGAEQNGKNYLNEEQLKSFMLAKI